MTKSRSLLIGHFFIYSNANFKNAVFLAAVGSVEESSAQQASGEECLIIRQSQTN